MANPVIEALSDSAAVQSAVAELREVDGLSDPEPRTESTDYRRDSFFSTRVSGRTGYDISEDELDRYWRLFEAVPMIRESIRSFAAEVMKPGYWVELPDDVSNKEEKRKKIEHWLDNCGIIAGKKQTDFTTLARKCIIQREVRGSALLEKSTDSDGNLAAFWFIPLTDHLRFQTYPNQPILLDPDPNTNRISEDTLEAMETTDDGEYGAYIQEQYDGSNVVLTTDDVLKLTRDEDYHEILGTSRIESVADRVDSLLNKLKANDDAIQSVAWKFWLLKFGSEEDPWPEEDVKEFMQAHSEDEFSAGTKQGVTGDVEIDTVSGEVAEIADALDFDLNWIMSAMPVPRYAIGAYASTINQFVSRAQETRLELQIEAAQREIENEFSDSVRRKMVEEGWITEDQKREVNLHIETPPEEKPLMEIGPRGKRVAMDPGERQRTEGQTDTTRPASSTEREARRNASIRDGDTPPRQDPQTSQMSGWEHPDPQKRVSDDMSRYNTTREGSVTELADAAVRGAQVGSNGTDDAAAMDIAELKGWSPGDRVSVDDTKGLVVEKYTDNFEWEPADGKVKASSDNPIYQVALVSGGSDLYEESALSDTTFDIPDDVESEDEAAEADLGDFYDEKDTVAELIDIPGVDDPEVGWSSFPPTWEDSEVPARLILLDAWTSMGASFTGAKETFMTSGVPEPGANRLAASMKDEVYGTEEWR